jgi:hypothetical protein
MLTFSLEVAVSPGNPSWDMESSPLSLVFTTLIAEKLLSFDATEIGNVIRMQSATATFRALQNILSFTTPCKVHGQ